ncbi:MAG: ABC transporter permease [Eubacteriales bacterium]|jgi:oligopeptide transport system permease protein|nr:ABC transporter permease [Eubacteriales bacterium]
MQLSDELFMPLEKEQMDIKKTSEPGLTYWRDVWRRLKKNKVAMVSLGIIILIFALSIIGPLLSPYSYSDQLRGQEKQWPSWQHPMGTDSLGRDMLVRVLYGGRISLSIGIVASLINIVIGVLYGGISGYVGGKVDSIMMRICDIIYSIPLMLYVILLTVVLKPSLTSLFELPLFSAFKSAGAGLISIYIAIGISYWIVTARIVRGQILSLKEQEYITAAKALGAGGPRILLRHLIPNCIGPIIVTTMLQIPDAIFTESFLSFVGLGVDAPVPSWGGLASDAVGGIRSYFYLLLFPSLAISITMLVFNLFGDGLRNALDPRIRK